MAYAFLAFPFLAVRPVGEFEQLVETLPEKHGYELFGYWPFLCSDEADQIIQAHVRALVRSSNRFD